jgi:hypothetical protein
LKQDLRLLALRLYVERSEGFELRMRIGNEATSGNRADPGRPFVTCIPPAQLGSIPAL